MKYKRKQTNTIKLGHGSEKYLDSQISARNFSMLKVLQLWNKINLNMQKFTCNKTGENCLNRYVLHISYQ